MKMTNFGIGAGTELLSPGEPVARLSELNVIRRFGSTPPGYTLRWFHVRVSWG